MNARIRLEEKYFNFTYEALIVDQLPNISVEDDKRLIDLYLVWKFNYLRPKPLSAHFKHIRTSFSRVKTIKMMFKWLIKG